MIERREKSVALVRILRAKDMTVQQRQRVAKWLKATADSLRRNGEYIADDFEAEYFLTSNKINQ